MDNSKLYTIAENYFDTNWGFDEEASYDQVTESFVQGIKYALDHYEELTQI